MKTPSKREIARGLLVVLLFVVFGCGVPGCAESKGTAEARGKAT